MKLTVNPNISLVDYENLSESILIKSLGNILDFPDRFFDFNVVSDNEYFVEIEFKNYQNSHCAVRYHKTLDTISIYKGNGGRGNVNFNYICVVNRLLELGFYSIEV